VPHTSRMSRMLNRFRSLPYLQEIHLILLNFTTKSNMTIPEINEWNKVPDSIKEDKELISFFRDLYEESLKEKDSLNSMTFSFISLIALLTGGLLTVLGVFSSYDLDWTTAWYIHALLCCMYAIGIVGSMVYIVRSLFKNYGYITSPVGIFRQAISLTSYLQSKGNNDSVVIELNKDLLKQYIEYSEMNSFSNQSKQSDYNRSKQFAALALLFGIFSFASYYYIEINKGETQSPTKVAVVSDPNTNISVNTQKDKQMPNGNNSQNNQQPTNTSNTAHPNPTAQPTPIITSRPVMQAGSVRLESARPEMSGGRRVTANEKIDTTDQ